ncbi:SPOR domain-containing protein [Geminicoccus roseus]|uniref:SPOR domain-containing protein n=1 Tax=Geminicoccus roseus TaxID=404900 RepID=UPI0003FA9DB6|nr:tetratricopeptide repeat protein [Geminicoccus roseus]
MAVLFLSTSTSVRGADDPLIDAYLQGVDLYRKGDLDAAIPKLRRAAELSEQRFGDQSPELALDLNNLAEALRRRGDLDEAEKLLRRAYAIDQGQDEPDSLAAAATLNNLGLVLAAKGDPEAALSAHRQALAMVENTRGNDHPDTARAAYNLALAEAAAGNMDIARALAARAAFVSERALGDRHPVTRQMRDLEVRMRGMPDPAPAIAAPPARPAAVRTAPAQPSPAATADDTPATTAVAPPPTPKAASAAVPVMRPAGSIQQRTGEPSATGGERSFAVQLMALRSEADLDAAWNDLRQRHERLGGVDRLPTTYVDIEGKGRFYRLLVGPFLVRGEAEELCAGLKQDGGDCRVIIRN